MTFGPLINCLLLWLLFIFYFLTLRLSIPYLQCSWSGMFIRDPGSEFFHPKSLAKKIPDPDPDLPQRIWVILTLKTVSKLLEKWSRMFIPDHRIRIFLQSWNPEPGPGSGSATLQVTYRTSLFQVVPVMPGAILAVGREMALILPASVGTDSSRGSDGATL